ncbi:MAG: cyclic nucleotide-binding domain-containing protein [Vicinamibacteria bacterium]|nr:cyclic nucleotide-binding domain-containing protein [Vicinamibacteria bacterium]
MALGFGPTKQNDIATLIARKQYGKAIELIRARLRSGRPDPRLRLQLADVLALAGKNSEAVSILLPLADEFAQEGFAAKAISVLKKIQRLDPGRYDIEGRLAGLIETKQRLAKIPRASPAEKALEIGIEGLGIATPAAVCSVKTAQELPPPVVDFDLVPIDAPKEPLAELPDFAPREEFQLDDADLDIAAELDLENAPSSRSPLSDNAFAEEILSIIDEVLPAGGVAEPLSSNDARGTQIVVSPLFKDFSVDELVAVIQGLKLLSFAPRQVIIHQGDRGDSLYMLTSGRVRAFVKDAERQRQLPIADLEEGAFFGEVSILTGKPRMATIVAATTCELLELERATLQSIAEKHPHVWDVMEDFARQRLKGRLR